MQPKARTHSAIRYIALGINLALIAVAAWVFFNRQYVLDQITLYRYEPPQEVIALAEQTTMTDESKRYFYASQPEINDRAEFNGNCGNHGERSIVLGCYAAQKIYIFNVTDERLSNVKAVTAAHEMLHAAYDRLGSDEKQRVDMMVTAQFEQLEDPRIDELVKIYNRTEPGQLDNEMHSILATEVTTLSSELEEYYKQYFADRQTIVRMSASYEQLFSNLKSQQESLVVELNDIAASINQRSSALNADVEKLNNDVSEFNRRAQANDFDSQSQFDNERSALTSRQQQLQAERRAIEDLIATYNQKKDQLDAINLEAQSLNTSINSNLDPIPNVQ
jgi:DNA repair exonuclease SbcCD ATPase subunit